MEGNNDILDIKNKEEISFNLDGLTRKDILSCVRAGLWRNAGDDRVIFIKDMTDQELKSGLRWLSTAFDDLKGFILIFKIELDKRRQEKTKNFKKILENSENTDTDTDLEED